MFFGNLWPSLAFGNWRHLCISLRSMWAGWISAPQAKPWRCPRVRWKGMTNGMEHWIFKNGIERIWQLWKKSNGKPMKTAILGGQGLVEISSPKISSRFSCRFESTLMTCLSNEFEAQIATDSYGMHRYATVLLSHPACFVIMLVMLVMLESRHIATHDPASSWAMQSFQAHFEQFGQISDCVVSNSDLRLPFRTCAIWAERWETMRRPETWEKMNLVILWHVVTWFVLSSY